MCYCVSSFIVLKTVWLCNKYLYQDGCPTDTTEVYVRQRVGRSINSFPFSSLQCSKLGPRDQGDSAMKGALHSLAQLDLGYIDLYLIHWPGTQGLSVNDKRNPGTFQNKYVFFIFAWSILAFLSYSLYIHVFSIVAVLEYQ